MFLTALFIFLISQISTAEAKKYYFFESAEGIVQTEASYPFCELDDCSYSSSVGGGEVSEISLAVSNKMQSATLASSAIVNSFTLSGDGSQDAELQVLSLNEDVVLNDDVAIANGAVIVANVLTEGTARIVITAEKDGLVVAQDYYELEVSSYVCGGAVNPLFSIVNDGTDYLIGRKYGTTDDLPIIAKKQLLCLSVNQNSAVLTDSYKLTTDVGFYSNPDNEDWDGSQSAGDGVDSEGWKPLGNSTEAFSGEFNGNGKSIYNLFINRPSIEEQGFFGKLGSNAVVTGLGLTDIDITGGGKSAGLAGIASSIAVTDSYVTGKIKGSANSTGGMLGSAGNVIIANVRANVNVTGSAKEAGGLIGTLSGSADVDAAYAEGNVTISSGSDVQAGGLIGVTKFTSGQVSNCYATGDVTGSSHSKKVHVGGLIARAVYKNVINSYATGSVSGFNDGGQVYAGGLLGSVNGMTNPFSPYNSYADWSVEPMADASSGAYVGGFLGGVMKNTATLYNESGNCDDFAEQPGLISQCELLDALEIQAGGDNAAWDSAVWNLDGSARPTLKNMP